MLTVRSPDLSERALQERVTSVCSQHGALEDIKVFLRRPGWDTDPFALVRMSSHVESGQLAAAVDGTLAGPYVLIPLRLQPLGMAASS